MVFVGCSAPRSFRVLRRNSPYHSPCGYAIVETLLAQCQTSAPLLKLFPEPWQRALLSNIVLLVIAVILDLVEGLKFQILGHKLSLSFTPITDEDVIRHLGAAGTGFRRRRPSP